MDHRAVGVFDSGLGGLTAVRELRRLLPSENIIYLGDTSRVPYGGKSEETLVRYSRQDLAFLRTKDVKAALIACGTATTAALPALQQENEIPVLGVVDAACRRALEVTDNHRIGLIATAASVRSGVYERTMRTMDGAVRTVSCACPLFVALVENGRYRRGDPVVELVAREYLEPMKATGVDTLILGCTHFPLLQDVIAEIMGPEVTLVNAGAEAARALADVLREKDLLAAGEGSLRLYASGDPAEFGQLAAPFLDEPLENPVEPAVLETE